MLPHQYLYLAAALMAAAAVCLFVPLVMEMRREREQQRMTAHLRRPSQDRATGLTESEKRILRDQLRDGDRRHWRP